MTKKTAEEKHEEKRIEKLGKSKKVADYTLPSTSKYRRARLTVGESASDETLLVEYDMNGGLILQEVSGEYKVVPTGTFYDFEKKAPKVKKEKKDK